MLLPCHGNKTKEITAPSLIILMGEKTTEKSKAEMAPVSKVEEEGLQRVED